MGEWESGREWEEWEGRRKELLRARPRPDELETKR